MGLREFILTVGNVELYDSSANLVLTSETEISNSITQSVDTQEIRGGEFNQLFLEYSLTKNLETTLTDARFIPEYLAINNGTLFGVETTEVYETTDVELGAGGTGTFAAEAVGDIYVIRANNTISTITPDSVSGGNTNFTVSGGTDGEDVNVRYRTSKSVEKIDIEANRFPSTFKLVITTGIFNADNGQGQRIGNLQIIQPNFKIMGNMEMTFDSGTPYQSTLSGKALSFRNDDGEDIYAEVIIDKTISNFTEQISGLFVTPNTGTLAASETLQLQTIGDLGNGKIPIRNPSGVAFSSSDTGVATVGASTGLITAVAAGSAIITATLTVGTSTYTDTVAITVS